MSTAKKSTHIKSKPTENSTQKALDVVNHAFKAKLEHGNQVLAFRAELKKCGVLPTGKNK